MVVLSVVRMDGAGQRGPGFSILRADGSQRTLAKLAASVNIYKLQPNLIVVWITQ
jgi:hypothetical protein